MGILPLRPDRRRLVQTAGNGVLDLPMLDRSRRGRGSWHVPQRKLKTPLGGRIGADSVPPRSGSVHTTERYLGWKQKIRRAVNDAIALEDA